MSLTFLFYWFMLFSLLVIAICKERHLFLQLSFFLGLIDGMIFRVLKYLGGLFTTSNTL